MTYNTYDYNNDVGKASYKISMDVCKLFQLNQLRNLNLSMAVRQIIRA